MMVPLKIQSVEDRMRKSRWQLSSFVGGLMVVLLGGVGVANVIAQDPAPDPARGQGRGRGGLGGPIVTAPGGGRGGRGAPAPIDAGGVQRRRLGLDTVIFTDAKGMTLYVYAKDTPGQSACDGTCAKNWPPLAAAADAQPTGDWTIVTRADGTRQWAHQGRPLYTFVKDTKPGDRTGDGVGGAWRAASPFVPYVRQTQKK
jgi:predicted lipoprotein with Yx(FWY)xxD motif